MSCCLSFNAAPTPINVHKASSAEAVRVELNWSLRPLSDNDVIETSDWTVFPPGDLTLDDGDISGFITSILIESGEQGQLYRVTNTITTDTGETLTQELQVYVTATPTIFVYT
jgi:hypothetical protein